MKTRIAIFVFLVFAFNLQSQTPAAWNPNPTPGGAKSMLFKFTNQVWLNPTIILAKQNFEQATNVKLLILPRLNSNDTAGSSRIEKAFDKLLLFLVFQENIQGSIKFFFDPHNPAQPFTFGLSDELHCKFNPLEKDTVKQLLNQNIANSTNLTNFTALPFDVVITQASLYCKKILQSKPGACGPNPENEFTLTKINTTPAKLNFERTPYQKNSINGGLDKQKYAELAQHYNTVIDIADNSNYAMAWKAMAANSNEFIKLKLKKKQSSFDISKLVFKNAAGTETYNTTFQSSDSTISLSIAGKPPGSMAEVVAYYTPASTPPQTFAIGAFNVQFYQAKALNVVLVNLGGAAMPNINAVADTLNKIYGNAFIKWNVSIASCNLPPEISKSIHIENSSLLSNYMQDMQPIVSHFKDSPAYNGNSENTYYLLFGCTNDGSVQGYMPRARNTGFIFDVSPHTIAHELGHGAFNLKHIFNSDELGEGKRTLTDNLMDYAVVNASAAQISQQSALYKHQWDLIHDPSFVGWFEGDDEDAASASMNAACFFDVSDKYLYAPNGFLFKAPPQSKILYILSSYMVNGFTYGIHVNNKNYFSDIPIVNSGVQPGDEFNGFKTETGESLPLTYSNSATLGYFAYKNNNFINLYKIPNAQQISGSIENKYDLNAGFAFSQLISNSTSSVAATCNSTEQLSVDQLQLLNKYKNFTVKSRTYIYDKGQLLTFYSNGKKYIKTFSSSNFQQLKQDLKDDKLSNEDAYLLEKSTSGYSITVNYGSNVNVKAGYNAGGQAKQKSEEAFEKVFNEYLKNKQDLSQQHNQQESQAFEDGKKISVKNSNIWDLVCNGVKATKEFIQEAEITPKYWNSTDPSLSTEYANNWVNTPPLLSGVGNGVIEEIKEIPQLVFMGAELATSSQARDKLWTSLKGLSIDKIKNAASSTLNNWTDSYAQGGDGAWHQGGKDGVMIFSILTPVGFLKNADDALSKNLDDAADKVRKKGVWKIFLDDTFTLQKRAEVISQGLPAQFPNLSIDELTAIKVYTSDQMRNGSKIYQTLNTELRAGALSDFNNGLNDFVNSGLGKLTPHNGSTVFRGCGQAESSLAKSWKAGDDITFMDFKSSSVNEATATTFMNQGSGDVIYEIANPKGYNICNISCIPGEAEILFKSGAKFKVTELSYMPRFVESDPLVRVVKLTFVP